MRPKRDAVPRARDAWIWLGGIAVLGVLGGGVTAAAVVLWENVDIRQLAPQLTAAAPAPHPLAEPPAPPAFDTGGFEAVVFASPRNQAYFSDAAYYPSALEAWSQVARDVGGVVRGATTVVDLRQSGPDDVLVLVESPCLSADEIDAVRAHLRAGGGVVANWAVGARDEECAWRGWGTVAELTGAEDVRELPVREGLFLTVPAGVPLGVGFDPGTRIELRPEPSLALRGPGPRVYWSDWALNPEPDPEGAGADVAAVASRTPEGGRIAWFGFRLSQAVTATDSLRLSQLFENGMKWAAGIAFAAPAAWPGGERAALVFTLDVEEQSRNALDMTALLREEQLPGSFFAVSQIVQEDAALGEALAAVGEVGTQTSDHTPLVGLTPQDQRVRLRRSWADIEAWTGRAPAGLHPPEETWDSTTLAAWQLAGGRYILATNEARSASPEVHRTPDGALILLPRLLRDDYNLIVQERVIRASSLERAFLDDANKMHAIGGLAIVAGHTQIIRAGPRLEAVRNVADSARAQGDWWIARAEDVADWWMVRADVRLTFVPADESGFVGVGFERASVSDVLVQAPSGRGVDGLWVDLVLPRGSASVIAVVDGSSVDFAATEWGVRVPLPSLAPGGSARISLLVPTEGRVGAP